jgi:hypothetical protein
MGVESTLGDRAPRCEERHLEINVNVSLAIIGSARLPCGEAASNGEEAQRSAGVFIAEELAGREPPAAQLVCNPAYPRRALDQTRDCQGSCVRGHSDAMEDAYGEERPWTSF